MLPFFESRWSIRNDRGVLVCATGYAFEASDSGLELRAALVHMTAMFVVLSGARAFAAYSQAVRPWRKELGSQNVLLGRLEFGGAALRRWSWLTALVLLTVACRPALPPGVVAFSAADMTRPVALSTLEFVPPPAAVQQGVQGVAEIECVITEIGEPRDCSIKTDLPHGLGRAILMALRAQRFRPAMRDGTPLAVLIAFSIRVPTPFDANGLPPNVLESSPEMTPPFVISGPLRPRVGREAARHGVAGLVLLRCIITDAGVPTSCYIQRDLPYGVGDAVLAMVQQQRYSPALQDGRPISVAITLPIQIKMR